MQFTCTHPTYHDDNNIIPACSKGRATRDEVEAAR